MKSLVSVIVPVYQAEKYLTKCVSSILDQSYNNLEVILIDDGSTDKSPQICDGYANLDRRVKVIHKENGGASSARNKGIEIAGGEYICFVDSDDYMPQHAVKNMLKFMILNNCQYVAGMCKFKNSDKVKNNILDLEVIDYKECPDKLLAYISTPGSYSPYAKIFSSKIIKKENLRYNIYHKCSEDSLFVRQYLRYCNRICLIPEEVYIYNSDNENSLSKKRYPDKYKYYINKLEALDKLTQNMKLDKEKKNKFLCERAVHGLLHLSEHYISNWSNEEEKKKLVVECALAMSGWIDVRYIENCAFKGKVYTKIIKNFGPEIYYYMVNVEFKIKKIIKSILKRS